MSATASKDAPDSVPLASLYRSDCGRLVCYLLLGYLLLIVVCCFVLRIADVKVGGGEFTFDRAAFLSVSTATLTGFQQSIGFNDFNPQSAIGPTVMLLLTVAGSLTVMIVGSLAAVRVLRLGFTDHQVISAALTAELLAVLAGTALILSSGGAVPLSDAIQQAACAFGDSQAVITSKGHVFKPVDSFVAQGVLLPLAILGGLGLPVLMELYHRLFIRSYRFSTHTRTVVVLTAATYAVGAVLLLAATWPSGQAPTAEGAGETAAAGEWREIFLAASTTAINARTAGLPFDTLKRYTHVSQWIVVLLMMIGANSAGTAGGIKLATFLVLFTGFRNVLRGRAVTRIFGIAGAWLGTYLLLTMCGFLAMLVIEPQMSADGAIFLVISALSNVGMSHDPLSIVGKGLYLLDAIMLAGRLAPLGVLWWMAKTTRDAELLVG